MRTRVKLPPEIGETRQGWVKTDLGETFYFADGRAPVECRVGQSRADALQEAGEQIEEAWTFR